MCSGSEAGSYSRLIDLVYHSTLGLKEIQKKKTQWKKKTQATHTACAPEPSRAPRRPLLQRAPLSNVQRFRGGLVFKAHGLLRGLEIKDLRDLGRLPRMIRALRRSLGRPATRGSCALLVIYYGLLVIYYGFIVIYYGASNVPGSAPSNEPRSSTQSWSPGHERLVRAWYRV